MICYFLVFYVGKVLKSLINLELIRWGMGSSYRWEYDLVVFLIGKIYKIKNINIF